MKILAINPYHDMSFCLYDSSVNFFQYIKSERIFSEKHFGVGIQGGKIKIKQSMMLGKEYADKIQQILKKLNFTRPDLVATIDNNYWNKSKKYSDNEYEFVDCLTSDHSISKMLDCLGVETKKCFFVGHHYAHILSGFLIANKNKIDYGVCIDGQGNDITVSFFKNPLDNLDKNNRFYILKNHKETSIGNSFTLVGQKMKLSGLFLDFSGKVMGAQSYGKIDENYIESLDLDYVSENFARYTSDLLDSHNDNFFNFENKEFRNFLCTWHKVAELSVLNLFNKNIKDKNSSIIYSGGVVQNTVINESLFKNYPNLFFLPHGYDGGLSLGVLFASCKYFDIKIPQIKNFPYIQYDNIEENPSKETIKFAASCLSKGMIIGWHQGRGEIGPRALGNRSILMHPGLSDGKNILNFKVKKREHWRPYAASVLKEYAHQWFDFQGDSPYMMRAIKTKKEKIKLIESVVHEDETCRIQTVSKENNSIFYDLILEFYKLTGIPMVLNTSMNLGGKPISSCPADSESLFRTSKMDYLFIGNRIKNKTLYI